MSCRITRKNGKIDRVLAPNGEDSILYQNIKNSLNEENIKTISKENTYIKNRINDNLIKDNSSEEIALGLWSMVYTPEFKSWFGDWKEEPSYSNLQNYIDKFGFTFTLANNNKLISKISQFIQKAGFKLESLEAYNEHLKAQGKNFNEGVNALINMSEGIIALSKGATDYDFVEEAAHLAIELHPDDSRIQRALDLVIEEDLYKKNVEGYTRLYSEQNPNLTKEQVERKVRKEILGKLVANHVLSNNKQGIAYRLFRTLQSIWDKVISIFKTQPLDELNSFVKGTAENMLNSNFKALSANISSDEVYASMEEISEARKALKSIIDRFNNRLISLRSRKETTKSTQRLEQNIKKLQSQLDALENEEGLISFIEFVKEDVGEARDYIENVKNKKRSLTASAILNLREFIEYYTPLLHNVKRGINAGKLFNDLSKERRENLIEVLKSYLSAFDDIKDFYDEIAASVNKDNITTFFTENNIPLDFDIEKAFSEIEKDVHVVQSWGGSIRDLGSNIARVIYAMVAKTVQFVDRQATEIGRNLVNKIINEYGIKDSSVFAEKSNGRTTGFFVTKYKLGEFFNDYDNFFDNLRKEFELEDGQREPSDIKKALEFRNKINKYLAENTERIYTKEYYDLTNNLSADTREALLYINMQKQDITNRIKDENGRVDYYDLTEANYQKLLDLEIERSQLAKLYEADGTKKVGTALKIAEELTQFNKDKKDKLKYETLKADFAKEYAKMKAKLPEDQFKKWVERNTEETYTQEFWDDISSLEKAMYPEHIQMLYDKKSELLSPYRKANMEIRYDKLPSDTIEAVKEIDRQIAALQEESGKTDPAFFDMAGSMNSKFYNEESKRARERGEYDKWYEENHYKNYKGKMVPYSFWTHLVPKKVKYFDYVTFKEPDGSITKVNAPAKNWSELSKNSEFYNKNFDENYIGIQPKISKWKNNDYDKLTDIQKKALDELLKLKKEMDQLLPLSDRNLYMLPQISQSLNDMLSKKDLTLSSFKELIKDEFASRVDDTEFGSDAIERPDGSAGLHVPMHYTRMLENPETISTDVVSSMILYSKMAINFKEMTKLAPNIEIMKEQLGQAKYKKGNVIKRGKDTNVYSMIETFIEMQMYGKMREKGKDIKIWGTNIKVNVSKIANTINSYVRANNLMFNLFSMLSGFFNGTINSVIEDLVGRYTTTTSKNLARKEYGLNLASAVSETKAITKKVKMNVMLEHFKVLSNFDKIFDNLDKDKFLRYTREDVVYAGYGLGDYALKTHLALAVLFNYRYYNGKFYKENDYKKLNSTIKYTDLVSVYDMYEVVDGKFVPKNEYKNIITREVEDFLEYSIKTITTKADGVLSDLDRAKIHQSIWGQLAATHRGWLMDGIARRWKAKGVNYMTNEVEVGYHREFKDILVNTLFSAERIHNIRELLAVWDTLEDYQKEAVLRTMFEMAAVAGLIVVSAIINGMADDDDDDNYALEFAAYLSNRVLLETAALSFTPTPVPYTEVLTVLNSPVAGTKQIEVLQDLPDLLDWRTVERGPYKGYPRAVKTVFKLLPGVKGAFMLRDPQSANQFLKNKPLKWHPSYWGPSKDK